MIEPRYLSAHCYPHRELQDRQATVLHYISGRWAFPHDPFNAELVFRLISDLNRNPGEREFGLLKNAPRSYASYHWLIPRNGKIWELVPPNLEVWHAGISEWKGRKALNKWAFGVALIADSNSGYTMEQYLACAWLQKSLQFNFEFSLVVGHSDVAHEGVRPDPKHDPGDHWNWGLFRSLNKQGSNTLLHRWNI